MNLEDEEVRKLKISKFKEFLQNKVNSYAARYFADIQSRQTKSQHLEISPIFKPASYLSSQKLTISEIQTLFLLRCRSINVKGNQSSAHEGNMWCRACKLFPEHQQHILQCSEIRKKVNFLDVCKLRYEMIYVVRNPDVPLQNPGWLMEYVCKRTTCGQEPNVVSKSNK